MRPSWDEYFLMIAKTVSMRADCKRAQVGFVLVDTNHRIVSTGYNGPPSGDPRSCSKGECPRAAMGGPHSSGLYTNCIALHAEQNAVAWADRSRLHGATAYGTQAPCPMCEKLLQASGIVRTVIV